MNSTSSAVSLVINAAAPAFNLAIVPESLTVTRSTPAMATITVTPLNGFTGQVQFSCLNLPVGVVCDYMPGSVTVNGAPASTTLSVKLDAMTNSRRGSRPIDTILDGGAADDGDSRTGSGLSRTLPISVLFAYACLPLWLLQHRKARGNLETVLSVR